MVVLLWFCDAEHHLHIRVESCSATLLKVSLCVEHNAVHTALKRQVIRPQMRRSASVVVRGKPVDGLPFELTDAQRNKKKSRHIFATHLHELFQLPLNLANVSNKRMGLRVDEQNIPRWTYTLENGTCVDSMALHTAKMHGISPTIVNRAEELVELFDKHCRAANAGPNDASSWLKLWHSACI